MTDDWRVCLACVCGVIRPRDDDQRGTVLVLISMVCLIFAVIMQVTIPICDIFEI